jgi:hypothetical protein
VRETSCLVAFYWANFLGKVLGTKKGTNEKAKKKRKRSEKGDGFIFQKERKRERKKGWIYFSNKGMGK